MIGVKNIAEIFGLGGRAEIIYGYTTIADSEIVSIIPEPAKYVYLISITCNVGSDGDILDCQILDKDGIWRSFLRLKLLGNTSIVWGAPNIKLDKVNIAGTVYEVYKGDGVTKTFRIVSRGTGPWECTVLYFCEL